MILVQHKEKESSRTNQNLITFIFHFLNFFIYFFCYILNGNFINSYSFVHNNTLIFIIHQSKIILQFFLSSAIHKISASLAVGLNGPVSMELIVLRDTPTKSESACYDSFFSVLTFLRLFFNINVFNLNI